MITVNGEWKRIECLNDILFELGSLFLECNLDDNDYFINNFPDDWCIFDLEIRVLNTKAAVYQGMMSRKLLKKKNGNISKSLTFNEALKQMVLKPETIECITRLLIYMKGVERYE